MKVSAIYAMNMGGYSFCGNQEQKKKNEKKLKKVLTPSKFDVILELSKEREVQKYE